jgi:Tol biopolymer transport system component
MTRKRRLALVAVPAVAVAVAAVFLVTQNSPPPTSSPIGEIKSVPVKPIPETAAIIFWSTRNSSGPALGPGFVYTMDIDGGNITQITFNPEPIEHTAASHDRRYVATDQHDVARVPYSLWVFDLERKTEARLVPGFYAAGGGGMDWSPDGFIYFAGEPRKDAGRNIYKIKPDGSALTQLTFYQLKPTFPPDPAQTGDVSVSEDGSKVAFVRIVTRPIDNKRYLPNPQIWVMNSDGSDQHMVFNGGEELGDSGSRDAIGAYDPEISPDGTKVVFSLTNPRHRNFASIGVNTAHDIHVINIDGTGLQRLTSPGPVCIIPDWSDSKILFTEYNERDHYVGLAIMNPDGSGVRRLESGVELWRGGRHGKFLPPVAKPSQPLTPTSGSQD